MSDFTDWDDPANIARQIRLLAKIIQDHEKSSPEVFITAIAIVNFAQLIIDDIEKEPTP